jgi:hypothetical protein
MTARGQRGRYGARLAANWTLSPGERLAMARAALAWEARAYLLRAAPQCAQARRIADALGSLADALWPMTDESARQRTR